MTSNLPNVVNPYLTDVGVGLVFGLGYYLIKYIYGDNKAKDNDKEVSSSKILDWDNPKTIEDFNYLIKQNEENTKLNPFDVISKMNKAHIIPDITVYNNLLNSCISSRNDENFDMLTKEIFDFGSPILPDLSTFNIIMKFISCKLDGIDPNVNQNEANDLVSYMDKTFAQIKTYGQNNKLTSHVTLPSTQPSIFLSKQEKSQELGSYSTIWKRNFQLNPISTVTAQLSRL